MVREDPGIDDRHNDATASDARIPRSGQVDPARRLAGAGAVVAVVPLLRKTGIVRGSHDAQNVIRLRILDIGVCAELPEDLQCSIPRLGGREGLQGGRRDAVEQLTPGCHSLAVLDAEPLEVCGAKGPGRLHLHDDLSRDKLGLRGDGPALKKPPDLLRRAFLGLSRESAVGQACQGNHDCQ